MSTAALVGWVTASLLGACTPAARPRHEGAAQPRSPSAPAVSASMVADGAGPGVAGSAAGAATGPAGELAPPTTAAAAATADGAGPAPGGEQPLPFQLAWSRRGVPLTKSVVIAPWGDVVALGSRKLGVFAGDTGDPMADKGICYTFPEAFGFVGPRTGVLVCEDSVKLFTFPGLAYRGVRSLPGKARTASFGSKVVAVGFADGPVRVYDTQSWSQVGYFALGERASALALSADERTLAVALRNGRLVLCDLPSKQQRSLKPADTEPVTALAFSPDGEHLLAGGATSTVVWQVAGAVEQRPLVGIRGVASACWTSNEEVAAAVEAGVVLVALADGNARGLGGLDGSAPRPPVALALSADQRVLCLGAKDGVLQCLSKGPIPALHASAAAGPVPASGAVQPPVVMAGRIVGHTGQRLQVRALPHAELPPAGMEVGLLRHVLRVEGELTTYLWPEIARVRIDEVRGDRLTVSIVTDRSEAVLGDAVRNPFEYDTPIRLVWGRP